MTYDPKNIKFEDDARKAIFNGVTKLADVVVATLGPGGKKVLIEGPYRSPIITNDGVSVAKAVDLEDKFEHMGALMVRDAASKTNDVAGDGTTTSTLLAYTLIKSAMKAIGSGLSANAFAKALNSYSKNVIQELKNQATPVDSTNHASIAHIASISARDEEIGNSIADVVEKTGKDGVITVEEGSNGLSFEVVEGMRIDKGFITPYFITNIERQEAEITNPRILITDKKLQSFVELLPVLDQMIEGSGKKDLVIIAEDVSGDALINFLGNKQRGLLNVIAVKAPGFGETKKAILEDLATLTGGKVILEELGLKMEDVAKEWDSYLGKADRVVSTKDHTTIVGGKGEKNKIEERKSLIQKELDKAESKFDKNKLSERLAKLSSGVGVIKVGAATEIEQKDLRLRVEDAVNATKAALEEGIVAGGGVALLHATRNMKIESNTPEERMAIDVLKECGASVISAIAENSGTSGGVVVNEILSSENNNYGFNALTGEFVDVMVAGIIDPLKVVRTGFDNAVSVAVLFANLGAAMTFIPTEKKDAK